MALLSFLRQFLSGRPSPPPEIAPRHARREAARERHRETDDPLWTDADRHLGRPGRREVQDLAPGTPGAPASRRTIDDD
jgi:hypothetical protein